MSVSFEGIGEAPHADANMTNEELFNKQAEMQEWTLTVTALTNCMKSEHEGKLAVARNLK